MKLSIVSTLLLFAGSAGMAGEPSPYAGEQTREIKALSAEDVAGYLAGRGMGLARAAELNHYPGPKHVLELAGPLELTEAQRDSTVAIFGQMQAETAGLGAELVDRERKLDRLFASGEATEARIDTLVGEIAALSGRIRAAHLRAHVRQRGLLDAHQRQRYDALRGYASAAGHGAVAPDGQCPHGG